MIYKLGTICNAVGILIGLYITTFMLVAPNAPPPFVFGRKTAIMVDEKEKWTAQDLGTLARTKQAAAAIRSLKNAARAPAAPVLHVAGLQGIIDAATDADIRNALLKAAKGGDDRKKDPLAVFARTDNAAATCGSSGTAGGNGLDLCVERCERKPSLLDLRTPRIGACYTLCSLAISPCTQGLFSLDTSVKNWGVPRRNWVAEAKTIASLMHAKGVEMAQSMTVSTALADLPFWAMAAMDFAATSRIFQALYVIALIRERWKYLSRLRKREKEATDEVKKLKIKPLFKIRTRLLQREGFQALFQHGASAIYRESIKAAKAERQKEACRLLGGLVSRRSKRAMATSFVRWQGAAAAVVSASTEADATDGEDKVAG